MVQLDTQTKRIGAKKGYELLKKKSDALKVRFRDIMKEIARTKGNMADQVGDTHCKIYQLRWLGQDQGW